MRLFFIALLLVVLSAAVSAQQEDRQKALEEFNNLKQKAAKLEKIILAPDEKDLIEASLENAEVFRILPREKFNESASLSVRGGGAYYSFTKKSHSYNDTPQIELSQNRLSVGFYGASYGFIADLGKRPLGDISQETKETDYLINYELPKSETEARHENSKIGSGMEAGGITYRKSAPAITGHAYLLRAISFGEADILVAFKIHRRDTDGSLIIFWKTIKQFEKPVLERQAGK